MFYIFVKNKWELFIKSIIVILHCITEAQKYQNGMRHFLVID
jgi:hypothetical protein